MHSLGFAISIRANQEKKVNPSLKSNMTNDASEWVAITPLKPKLKILVFALSIHSQNEISYYLTQFSLLRCKWIPNCFSSQNGILKVQSPIISVHHYCWRLSQLKGNMSIINYPSGKITSHFWSFKKFISKIIFIWTKTAWESTVSIEPLWRMFSKLRSRERGRDTEGTGDQGRPEETHTQSLLNLIKCTTCITWNTLVPSKCQPLAIDYSAVALALLLWIFF